MAYMTLKKFLNLSRLQVSHLLIGAVSWRQRKVMGRFWAYLCFCKFALSALESWSERGQDQQVRSQLEGIANNHGKRWYEHEPSSDSCHFFCVCCFSVTKLYPTLYDPMNCSTVLLLQHRTGFPVLHPLPEFAQTHVHWVSLTSNHLIFCQPPSPLALNLSQHHFFSESALTSGGQSIGASASVWILPMNVQGWFPLGLTDLISLMSKGLSRVFSSSTILKHLFFSSQPSLWFLCV